jgi:hypothetical protein
VCLKSDMQNDINYQNRFTEKEKEKVKEKETEKEKDEKTFCDDRFLHNTERIYALRVSKNREFHFHHFQHLKKYTYF